MRISREIGFTLLLAVSSLTTQAEPCRAELDSRQLALSCPAQAQTRYEQASLATLQQGQSRMLTSAQVDYHWVDPAHTMAIIAISHR